MEYKIKKEGYNYYVYRCGMVVEVPIALFFTLWGAKQYIRKRKKREREPPIWYNEDGIEVNNE